MESLKSILDSTPLASIIAIVVVLTGAVICITNPGTLSFNEYLVRVGAFLAGTGILGLARSAGGKG